MYWLNLAKKICFLAWDLLTGCSQMASGSCGGWVGCYSVWSSISLVLSPCRVFLFPSDLYKWSLPMFSAVMQPDFLYVPFSQVSPN